MKQPGAPRFTPEKHLKRFHLPHPSVLATTGFHSNRQQGAEGRWPLQKGSVRRPPPPRCGKKQRDF